MTKLLQKIANVGTFGLVPPPKKKKKKAPKVAPAKRVMPEPDEEAIALARKRSIAKQLARSGRASTILTGGGGSRKGSGFGG